MDEFPECAWLPDSRPNGIIMSSVDKLWFAPNGGKLIEKNLNADSDHPNPWRPPTYWEAGMIVGYSDMRITTNTQPAMKSQNIEFEEIGLARNLQQSAILGLKFGSSHAAVDIINVTKLTDPKQVLGRWAYLTTPYVGMFTTYVAAYYTLNMMSKEKNQRWMYFSSAIPMGCVWGVFKRNFFSGFRVAGFMGTLMWTYKVMMDNGVGIGRQLETALRYYDADISVPWVDPAHKDAREVTKRPNTWKQADRPVWPMRNLDKEYSGYDGNIEPGWKQHLPEEDRNKGPPTGL